MWHSFRFSFNLGNFQASRYASDPAGHLRVWSVRSVGRPRRVGDGGGVADGAEAGLAAEADLIALVGEVGGCKEGGTNIFSRTGKKSSWKKHTKRFFLDELFCTVVHLLDAATVLEVVGKLKFDTLPVVPVKYCRQPSGPEKFKYYWGIFKQKWYCQRFPFVRKTTYKRFDENKNPPAVSSPQAYWVTGSRKK